MSCLLCTTALLLAAAPTQAPGGSTVNTLTPEESAEGWVLLFDGRTTSGWHIEGDGEVKGGALLLGGTRATRARLPRRLGRNIELRFEYQSPLSGGRLSYRLQEQGLWAGYEQGTVPSLGALSDWAEVIFTATYDPEKDTYRTAWKGRMLPDGQFDVKSSGSSRGLGPPRHAKDFWLEVPPGAKIAVRNVKLKGDIVAEAPSTWVWLLPLDVLLLLVLGAVALLIIRRRRRAVADDLSKRSRPDQGQGEPR